MTEPNAASEFATRLLHAAVERGVQHVVVSPGARAQALSLAAAQLARAGLLQLHVRHDERSAGFVALGIAIETGMPAIVITTSGSAVANLLPAVVEAHHAGVPMLVVTGDRPASLRARRSSQTTVQPGMFGVFVRSEFDVAAVPAETGPHTDPADPATLMADALRDSLLGRATQPTPGPVHVNIQFVEPLSGPVPELPHPVPASIDPRGNESGNAGHQNGVTDASVELSPGPRTVVVAGFRAGAAATEFAEAAGLPLLAEVVSGSRFGSNVVEDYRAQLEDPAISDSIERAIVFGTPTLSRAVQRVLSNPDVDVIIVQSPGADQYQPAGRDVPVVASVRMTSPEPGPWLRTATGSSAASGTEATAFDPQSPIDRPRLAQLVWHANGPQDRLVFAASRLIREADAVVPARNVWAHSNRGQAGIDGTISTAIGIALAVRNKGVAAQSVTRVLMGDVAAIHDAAALALDPAGPMPQLQVIVGNDNGGSIFDELEVAGTADPNDFERVLTTPHRVDFQRLAAAYGWDGVRVTTVGELRDALAREWSRPVLIEVPL